MKPELEALLTVLREEREAIRRLDGAGVERAAAEKEKLASALASIDAQAHRADLVIVAAELRRNGILLAHARSCLREAITLAKSRVEARM